MKNLLFTNVKLYDGTGRTPFLADVAVKDDKIAAVGNNGDLPETGATVINGHGLALTPGFVDVHTHSDSSAATVSGGDSTISQGVTTDISGNCGFSWYLDGVQKNEALKKLHGNFAAYADWVEKSSPALNVAHLCGHNSLRVKVMGYENRHATREELRQMKELLADALAQGAAGFSAGLFYLPGNFAPTEELKELAALLKGTSKPYATHIRCETEKLCESLTEAIDIAKAGNSNLELSHLKTSGSSNWHKLDSVFEIIENAQRSGVNILADRYPYIHSATTLRVLLSAPYSEIDTTTLCSKLKESAEFQKEVTESLKKYVPRPLERTLLMNSPIPEHRQYYGMSMVEIGQAAGCSPEEAVVKLLSSGVSPNAAFGTMCEENLKRILAKPYVISGSDGNVRSFDDNGTHPRAFGTMPKFFRLAAQSSNYESVIRRMTAMPAAKFNLTGRGIIAPGYFADLVLLDLEKFDSPADYAVPNLKASGVDSVYVNGKLAYSADCGLQTARSGRMLRIK
ncbi:MAG: amidohydrolase family protein [Lentisphaeria bacterium]|nr:amidohydrolase family protein [Lentisphaeria bacterium]